MSRVIKTKFKIENRQDGDNVMTFTISVDTNHDCIDIDKVIKSMSSCPLLNMPNYKDYVPKKKKKFSSVSNTV
jgi:hypothetical protein